MDILEQHKGRSGLPDTSSLYSVNMVLSDIGIERWKHVIAEKIAFTPFRNLEPLREMMTPKQIERLDALNS